MADFYFDFRKQDENYYNSIELELNLGKKRSLKEMCCSRDKNITEITGIVNSQENRQILLRSSSNNFRQRKMTPEKKNKEKLMRKINMRNMEEKSLRMSTSQLASELMNINRMHFS